MFVRAKFKYETGSVLGPANKLFRNEDAGIHSITVFGDFGNYAVPYDAVEIWAADGIGTIDVDGDLFANIDPKTSTPAIDGTIDSLLVGGDLAGNAFEGEGRLFLGSFDEIIVGGNFASQMILSNKLTTSSEFRVGLSLTTNGSIQIQPDDGLEGQIFLNATSTFEPLNGWSFEAAVRVGQTPTYVMTNRDYATTAAALGGGSIGSNAFGLHDVSCDPPNRAEDVTVDFGSGLDEIRLRHYGPIDIVGVNDAPVIIERRLISGGSYSELPDTDFEYAVDQLDRNSLIVTPAVGQPPFERCYEYRITLPARPAPEVLVCFDVDDSRGGPPPVDWDHPHDLEGDYDDYVVAVQPSVRSDFDGDDEVGINDFLLVLANWGGTGPVGDTNCDGEVDINDFLNVLEDWTLLAIEDAVEDSGLTMQQWDDAVDDLQDPEVSQAEKDNLVCWWEHYLECHPLPFCIECACQICPDDDPYGNH